MRRVTEIFSLSWRVVATWQYEISASGSVPCGEESVDDAHHGETGPQDLLVQHMQPQAD